jgi:hypothetical protein
LVLPHESKYSRDRLICIDNQEEGRKQREGECWEQVSEEEAIGREKRSDSPSDEFDDPTLSTNHNTKLDQKTRERKKEKGKRKGEMSWE